MGVTYSLLSGTCGLNRHWFHQWSRVCSLQRDLKASEILPPWLPFRKRFKDLFPNTNTFLFNLKSDKYIFSFGFSWKTGRLRNLVAVLSSTTACIEKKPPSSDLQRVNILRAEQNCINSSLNEPEGQEDSRGPEDTRTVRKELEWALWRKQEL